MNIDEKYSFSHNLQHST